MSDSDENPLENISKRCNRRVIEDDSSETFNSPKKRILSENESDDNSILIKRRRDIKFHSSDDETQNERKKRTFVDTLTTDHSATLIKTQIKMESILKENESPLRVIGRRLMDSSDSGNSHIKKKQGDALFQSCSPSSPSKSIDFDLDESSRSSDWDEFSIDENEFGNDSDYQSSSDSLIELADGSIRRKDNPVAKDVRYRLCKSSFENEQSRKNKSKTEGLEDVIDYENPDDAKFDAKLKELLDISSLHDVWLSPLNLKNKNFMTHSKYPKIVPDLNLCSPVRLLEQVFDLCSDNAKGEVDINAFGGIIFTMLKRCPKLLSQPVSHASACCVAVRLAHLSASYLLSTMQCMYRSENIPLLRCLVFASCSSTCPGFLAELPNTMDSIRIVHFFLPHAPEAWFARHRLDGSCLLARFVVAPGIEGAADRCKEMLLAAKKSPILADLIEVRRVAVSGRFAGETFLKNGGNLDLQIGTAKLAGRVLLEDETGANLVFRLANRKQTVNYLERILTELENPEEVKGSNFLETAVEVTKTLDVALGEAIRAYLCTPVGVKDKAIVKSPFPLDTSRESILKELAKRHPFDLALFNAPASSDIRGANILHFACAAPANCPANSHQRDLVHVLVSDARCSTIAKDSAGRTPLAVATCSPSPWAISAFSVPVATSPSITENSSANPLAKKPSLDPTTLLPMKRMKTITPSSISLTSPAAKVTCLNGHTCMHLVVLAASAALSASPTSEKQTSIEDVYSQTIESLAALGCEPNSVNNDTGATPLMLSCLTANPTLVRTLIRIGAKPGGKDRAGWNALLYVPMNCWNSENNIDVLQTQNIRQVLRILLLDSKSTTDTFFLQLEALKKVHASSRMQSRLLRQTSLTSRRNSTISELEIRLQTLAQMIISVPDFFVAFNQQLRLKGVAYLSSIQKNLGFLFDAAASKSATKADESSSQSESKHCMHYKWSAFLDFENRVDWFHAQIGFNALSRRISLIMQRANPMSVLDEALTFARSIPPSDALRTALQITFCGEAGVALGPTRESLSLLGETVKKFAVEGQGPLRVVGKWLVPAIGAVETQQLESLGWVLGMGFKTVKSSLLGLESLWEIVLQEGDGGGCVDWDKRCWRETAEGWRGELETGLEVLENFEPEIGQGMRKMWEFAQFANCEQIGEMAIDGCCSVSESCRAPLHSDVIDLDSSTLDGVCSDPSLYTFRIVTPQLHRSSETMVTDCEYLQTKEEIELFIRRVILFRTKVQFENGSSALLKGLRSTFGDKSRCLDIFSVAELKLLFCGAGREAIDLKDWRLNTIWTDLPERVNKNSNDTTNQIGEIPVGCDGKEPFLVLWFFSFLQMISEAERRIVLHFVTGSTALPIGGFACLTGLGGNKVRFKIKGIKTASMNTFPRAATCFNELQLPWYSSKELLEEKLFEAIRGTSGFDFA